MEPRPPGLASELVAWRRQAMHHRSTQTAGVGTARLITDGVCRGAAWIMTLDLSTLLAQRIRDMHDPLLEWTSIAALGAALAIALIGHDRLAGMAALVWTVMRVSDVLHHHPGPALLVAAPLSVCAATLRTGSFESGARATG